MKLHYLFLSIVLTISGLSLGSEIKSSLVQMPNAEILRAQFQEAEFDHFIEKTDIITRLADKQLYPYNSFS